MELIQAFIYTCVLEPYVLEEVSLVALLVALAAAIVSGIFWVIARIVRLPLTYTKSARLSFIGGLVIFAAGAILTMLSYCGFVHEDPYLIAIVVIAIGVTGYLAARNFKEYRVKSILTALVALALSYFVAVMALICLFFLFPELP